MNPSLQKCVLVILDGYGNGEVSSFNPIRNVQPRILQSLLQQYPTASLQASGAWVGLPDGQMGNSEVGHLHLGAGRRVLQGLPLIDQIFEDNALLSNAKLQKNLHQILEGQGTIHFVGLVSDGGVHSHIRHLKSLIQICLKKGIHKIYVHAILDGRDVPPKSAAPALEEILQVCRDSQTQGRVRIASIVGRYYAMDRDQRWERTEAVYRLMVQGQGTYRSDSALQALEDAYGRAETDEFVSPTLCLSSETIALPTPNDLVIFFNFRADRARQLSEALAQPGFTHFQRERGPLPFLSLTEYAPSLKSYALFPQAPLTNTLGHVLARAKRRQLRVGETEKFSHITSFFNGNQYEPLEGEERCLIPSSKVATYDLEPEMKAKEITQAVLQALHEPNYDFILCNYANADMVGHTGNYEAALKAISTLDTSMQQIVQAISKKADYHLCITADHGNAECMFDLQRQQPHTAHTTHPVPFCYIGSKAGRFRLQGSLIDVAPTILDIMNLTQPQEMTGRSLFK